MQITLEDENRSPCPLADGGSLPFLKILPQFSPSRFEL